MTGTTPALTNLFQVRQFSLTQPRPARALRLEGLVCWTNPAQNTFALMDESGGLILKVDALTHLPVIGQRLRLTGAGTIVSANGFIKIGTDALLVDSDGIPVQPNEAVEQSSTVFLHAGRIPIRVEWFNRGNLPKLKVSVEGPAIPRHPIGNPELFLTPDVNDKEARGLNYRCYAGQWIQLPDFNRLKPEKSGVSENFDLRVRTRDSGMGLDFYGFFDAPKDGNYKFYLDASGSRLHIGRTSVQAEVLGQEEMPAPRQLFIGQILSEAQDGSWGWIEGKVKSIRHEEGRLRMELTVGRNGMKVETTDPVPWPDSQWLNQIVRMTGFCQGAADLDGLKTPSLLLVPDAKLMEVIAAPTTTNAAKTQKPGRPVLTTIAEAQQLTPEQAESGYPIKVKGIVTTIDASLRNFTLQDSSSGIYVHAPSPMRIGEFVEVEGVTRSRFSRMITQAKIRHLGEGRLPDPIRPSWDQLINGSIDSQYVEIEGIVTSVNTAASTLQLLTSGGTISVVLHDDLEHQDFKRYVDERISIRGVLFAVWAEKTHEVTLGTIRIRNPHVTLIDTAQSDLLSAPFKTPAEMRLFDPQAGALQLIRMSGQVVHAGENIYYLMAGSSGARFIPKNAESLQTGDTVDIAGYLQLGNASPLLRLAKVQKTGHGALPEARRLPPNVPPSAADDATRVRMEGILLGVRATAGQTELELQSGSQNFVARLNGNHADLFSLPVGCRLELTGVCAVQEDNLLPRRHAPAFALLLDSTADIKILAQPPWWTFKKLLIVVGALTAILFFSVLWITQLRRNVEARTVQLKEQVEKRQAIEQKRVMEQERARVAQDLHDDLGSGLTEISMLASIPKNNAEAHLPMDEIGDRARNMVTALDEIVWAMNPKHDSVDSLGTYACLYADRFLKPVHIHCHLKGTLALPNQPLNPVHRHQFFLAFKEALTNVVRHSHATDVHLSLRMIGKCLRLSLADNGVGLSSAHPAADMDGLANMRTRLEKIGGRFTVASQPNRGTIVRFYLPLN